jgi:hypothetical protein
MSPSLIKMKAKDKTYTRAFKFDKFLKIVIFSVYSPYLKVLIF